MMKVLSIRYHTRKPCYARSWAYRTLIEAHRIQHSEDIYGKGYGPDWRHTIKRDVLEFALNGALPHCAISEAVDIIQQAEKLALIQAHAYTLLQTYIDWEARIASAA